MSVFLRWCFVCVCGCTNFTGVGEGAGQLLAAHTSSWHAFIDDTSDSNIPPNVHIIITL